jgi:hypothetical protein
MAGADFGAVLKDAGAIAHAAAGAAADENHRCSRRFREPAAGHRPAQSKDGSFLSQFVAYFHDSGFSPTGNHTEKVLP